LDFTRRQAATLEVVNLTEVVNETATMLNRILGEDICLNLRTDSSPVWTLGDPGRLSQILINLAVNARDAMPEGGTLTINTYDDAPAGRVMLTVRDTGHGMDARTRARLFEPFFTTKPKGEGTGIGLATVFEIVHESGGQIEIDTAPGRGAVFRITLPRADSVPASGGRKDEEDVLRGHETVLVVDDEPAIAELTARILLEYGYTVMRATGPGGAMVAFAERTTPVDLVLTDIMMPGISGRALVEQLRERDPKLAVLYMSGYSNAVPSSSNEAFISKPFTAQEIARAVRAVLDGRQLA
ncbi:MAG: ATP-binding protein, partial [Gemmatimonadales bacterium]